MIEDCIDMLYLCHKLAFIWVCSGSVGLVLAKGRSSGAPRSIPCPWSGRRHRPASLIRSVQRLHDTSDQHKGENSSRKNLR